MITLIGQPDNRLRIKTRPRPLAELPDALTETGPMVFHLPMTQSIAASLRDTARGLRRTLSQVSILTLAGRMLVVTDGFIHEQPDLKAMVAVVSNAISVARRAGIASPRVAVLSAVELVSPQMGSAVPAAVMEAMGRRGQFGPDVFVEGPLSMDVALSPQAAEEKHVQTPVAGQADVLVAHRASVARGVAATLHRFATPERFLSVLTDGTSCWPMLLPFMDPSNVADSLEFCETT